MIEFIGFGDTIFVLKKKPLIATKPFTLYAHDLRIKSVEFLFMDLD